MGESKAVCAEEIIRRLVALSTGCQPFSAVVTAKESLCLLFRVECHEIVILAETAIPVRTHTFAPRCL
jgi:hypothetical protein